MSGNSIKVVVRCRPMNSREIARGDTSIISMSGVSTTIEPPPQDPSSAGNKAHERKAMTFGFDHSYWSAGPKTDSDYATQETLYNDLGVGLLDHAFAGFNTCIFAYGQTGSGKSYSMMGYGPEKGIIPLTCSELFRRGDELASAGTPYKYTVEVSYIEIYNEKVRDLLNPKNKGNLKVREHPSLGPYVEDLSRLVVGNYDDMISMMDEGNKARTVAATQMNETSSRSHAVFTLILTQKSHDAATDLDAERVSRISLVDLAGSERANSTGATGARLKEGANINKSLTTLGKVIAALAAASAEPEKGKKKKKEELHIPFRDSVLTWLLKDSLGGNSQTAMIAAIAPSSASYDETLSTLRYADQAKKIKTRAVVNEDPNAKMIRELKEELEMLRTRAAGGGGGAQAESFWDTTIPPEKQMVTYQTKTGELRTVSKAELQDQMQASEKLMQSLNETWESKMEKTEVARKEREAALEELGISVEKGGVGVHTPKKVPHLVNLNEDPLMSEALVYNIKPGKTMVGNVEAKSSAAIRLSGSQILEEHCFFSNENGVVSLTALPESTTIVNGKRVPHDKPQMLKSGYRIILGDYHVFRFQNPMEVRLHREAVRSSMNVSISASDLAGIASGAGSPAFRPESPGSTVDQDGIVDWTFAKRELALARLNGQEPGLDTLKDEDLDKLFDNIQKVRTLRKDRTRPESRLSIADDFWERDSNNRHLSSTFTDDTSVDPSGSNPWGTFPSSRNGPVGGTPSSENVKEAQDLLVAQKEAYEARLSSLASSSSTSADREDFEIEKSQMQRSIELISQEMKRLRHLRSSGTVKESSQEFEPTVYSAKEIRLAKGALRRWKAMRTFGMAETVLTHAVKVKEANVISCSLGKKVSYNFTVTEGGSLSIPTSALDTISGLVDFEDASPQVTLTLTLTLTLTDVALITLPARLGGLGILSHTECAPLAYAAASDSADAALAPILGLPFEEDQEILSQRSRCAEVFAARQSELLSNLSPFEKLSVVEAASTLGRRWLSVIPFSPNLALTDAEVATGLHFRTLCPGREDLCFHCAADNTFGHDDVCSGRAPWTLARHEQVKRVLASSLQGSQDLTVVLEPTIPGTGLRTDFRVTSTRGGPKEFDLTIVSLATVEAERAARNLSPEEDAPEWREATRGMQAVLEVAMRKKVAKYAGRVAVPFVPLVVSIGGGLEDGTLKAMKEWREVMKDSQWSGMLSRISVTLLRARSHFWHF